MSSAPDKLRNPQSRHDHSNPNLDGGPFADSAGRTPIDAPIELSMVYGMTAAYIHVPFCRHRCGYCNFTLVADRDDLQPRYLDALERELSGLGEPRPVATLFIGGGTPTHLAPPHRERLFRLLNHWLPLRNSGDAEFSVEANPNDITLPLLESLAGAGVNRLSLGVQSFQDHVLQVLEREHQGAEALAAIAMAKTVIPRVSLDLIFAAPGQTIADWHADLQAAVAADIEHVSTYGLTYEKGAAFWGRVAKNTLTPAPEETERSMYLLAIERLNNAGFEHYEVSNFARPGAACRHNINYWQGGDYLAFGPGAARHHKGRRETNHRSATTYIKKMLAGESVVAETEDLTPEQQARERLVFGLRMRDGVARPWLQQTTGFSLDELAGESLEKHIALGMLEDDGVRVRFTESGLLVSDLVLVDFL